MFQRCGKTAETRFDFDFDFDFNFDSGSYVRASSSEPWHPHTADKV